jgi:hypothetical protein
MRLNFNFFSRNEKFFILGGWANPLVEPETLDDITLYD